MRTHIKQVAFTLAALVSLAGSSRVLAAPATKYFPGSICHLIDDSGANQPLAYNGTAIIGGNFGSPYIYDYCPIPIESNYLGYYDAVWVQTSYDIWNGSNCWIMAGWVGPNSPDSSLAEVTWTTWTPTESYKNSARDIATFKIPVTKATLSYYPSVVVECRTMGATSRVYNLQLHHN